MFCACKCLLKQWDKAAHSMFYLFFYVEKSSLRMQVIQNIYKNTDTSKSACLFSWAIFGMPFTHILRFGFLSDLKI